MRIRHFGLLYFVALATLLTFPQTSSAYKYWSDGVNDVGQCAACHGKFREGNYFSEAEGVSWGAHLHDVHLNNTDVESNPNGSCDSCHGGVDTEGRQVNLASSADAKDGVNAIACMGCHGRLEDANELGIFGEPGWGAGLRQHHENSAHVDAGPGTCKGCHQDADPAKFTPAPEDTMPPWFASITNTSIAMTMDPCSVDGEEDFSSNGTGLDNDGDHSYDALEDSDCAPPVFTAIVSLGDLNGNGSSEVGVAFPGSTRVHIRDGSTDALITDIDFGADVAFDMAVLPDLDASGDPEIAILQQQASGQVRVQTRDSVTGNVTKNLWYGQQYEPVSMDVVADYSGNGLPEIAVLGSEAGTDAVRVQIQDVSTGFLDNVFLGTQSIAKGLVSVADTSGNGVPEMGILGVLKANDQVRMQMWDADTATFQSNVWFAKVYQPQATITMPDINTNGSDEIVAMGVDPATQNIRVQVRDSDTTATLYNIWLGAVNEAVDIALINDINSDGVADLAVLLKTPDGTGRVRVQSGLNGNFIRNLFYSVVESPIGLAVMADYSGNGFEELAVLGENAGVRHVQILDTSSGSQVNRIDYP